ncbi:MAG TPA: class I SAM-dependent methyltransferase [Gemmatimonadales bacterium]|nr:class I SAM-dependent methyltransferase [Gemmatimonadales bacterium]
MGYSPLDLDPVVLPLVAGKTVLDLGCGFGHWGHLLRTHYFSDDPQKAARITGVDIHDGNVAFCRRTGTYDELGCADALEFLARQPAAAFDTIIATELIEHLPKPSGEKLLAEVVRVAAKMAILSTPNWEYLRPGAMTMTGFNEHEHHVSAWRPAEFRRRGFTVRGVGHKVRQWPVRGVNRALDALPTLDAMLAAWAIRHPAIALNIVAFRRG